MVLLHVCPSGRTTKASRKVVSFRLGRLGWMRQPMPSLGHLAGKHSLVGHLWTNGALFFKEYIYHHCINLLAAAEPHQSSCEAS